MKVHKRREAATPPILVESVDMELECSPFSNIAHTVRGNKWTLGEFGGGSIYILAAAATTTKLLS